MSGVNDQYKVSETASHVAGKVPCHMSLTVLFTQCVFSLLFFSWCVFPQTWEGLSWGATNAHAWWTGRPVQEAEATEEAPAEEGAAPEAVAAQ